jgi:hypothetical protein
MNGASGYFIVEFLTPMLILTIHLPYNAIKSPYLALGLRKGDQGFISGSAGLIKGSGFSGTLYFSLKCSHLFRWMFSIQASTHPGEEASWP